MPMIYEGRCAKCGYRSPHISEGYWSVILDEPSHEWFSDPRNERLAILGHPLEDDILKQIGHTWNSVTWGGRLLRTTEHVCKDCGNTFDSRRLDVANLCLGCLPISLFAIGIGLLIGITNHHFLSGWFAGLAAFFISSIGSDRLARAYVRNRHRDRVQEFDMPAVCSHCRSSRSVLPGARSCRNLTCPSCRESTLTIEVVGIS